MTRVRIATTVLLALACAGTVARADQAPYREPTLYTWNTTRIDILVLPPAHGQIYNDNGVLPAGSADVQPGTNSYLRGVRKGIDLWRQAIAAYAPGWLKGLEIRSYVVGLEPVPADAASDPEIVVTNDETMGPILGTSYPSHPCPAVVATAYHVSFTEHDVTNLTAHEVGHCLGLGHVDGADPAQDLMQAVYRFPDGFNSTPVECPSTLNVAALTLVFGAAAGHPQAATTAVQDPAGYATLC